MKQYKNIILLFSVIGIVLFAILSQVEKGEVVRIINASHSPFQDFLFKRITHLGDGLIFVFITLGLLFVGFRYALISLTVGVLHGIAVNVLKRGVFSDLVRPRRYFTDLSEFYFVPGVDVHGKFAFPSGHTTTAFAAALLLILIIRKKWWTGLFIFIACLVGYSRMYLFQHFYMDVVGGFVLGSMITAVVWMIYESIGLPAWGERKVNLPGSQ